MLTWFYGSSTGAAFSGGWVILAVGLAVAGALIVASYLPAAAVVSGGHRRSRDVSPCAVAPLAGVVLAAMMLSVGPTVPWRGVFAAAILGVAVVQRLAGTSTCSISPR
ncbi:MAG: hypothetical protein ACK5MP_12420 [Nostocoides sp.]